MINISQFKTWVIIPALDAIGLNSDAAQELLLGTALQESRLSYLAQVGGPALGVFQMEPATHNDIWLNFLAYKPDLTEKIQKLCANGTAEEMATNLLYAAAMCRVHYYRSPKPLPEAGAINAQAAYWKAIYNTPLGRGKASEYVDNWNTYVK